MPLPITAPESTRNQAGSLLTTAEVVASERLGDGVAFKAVDCLNGDIIEICPPGEPTDKTVDDPDGVVTFPSFAFFESAKCSTNANPSVIFEDTVGIASRQLDRNTSYWVERSLWTGLPDTPPIATSIALASQGANDLTAVTGPVGITTGVSMVIAGLNATLGGQRGIIHVPQRLIPFLDFYGLVLRVGNILQVPNTDHVYVAGTGYTGSDPDGVAAATGFSWIYGTGQVKVLLSDPFIPTPAVDRSVNEIEVRAERAAAAVFNPCAHVAAEVCIPDPGPDCGSA